jgi:NADH:ubiquinone oxidoreductase subunit 5 (subunit L)/multisubunit Na+/H+ antiporter MnhA subunit
VLGSALTLASFIKFISGIFLGRRSEELAEAREVSPAMWLPLLALALVCAFFGIMASQAVIPIIIQPLAGDFSYPGVWDSTAVSVLILVSILLGGLIYLVAGMKRFRSEDSFIGGELITTEHNYPVVEFYKTIREFSWLSWIYERAERRWFDLYEVLKKITLGFSKWLSLAHTGRLTTYALWIFVGLVIMLLVLI